MTAIKKKICLLGSFSVGKTSLVERFVHDRYDEKYLTTVGVKVSQKLMPPIDSHQSGQLIQHTFLIWDIAGLEKFDSVAMNYFRGAAGALAVADLTIPETIDPLHEFCEKFLSVSPRARLLILGNKLDLFQSNKQTLLSLEETARRYSSKYLLTSAKTGHHVELAFETLSKLLGNSDG
jgi:small GTP-binding protein